MAKNNSSWLRKILSWPKRRWRLYKSRKWHIDYFRKLGCAFVRSQIQLGIDKGEATGWRMSLDHVLRIFGPDVLMDVAWYGAAILVQDPEEPARTLRNRRLYLKLTVQEVAKKANLFCGDVLRAEDSGRRSDIHHLVQIAHVLGLNPDYISWKTGDPKKGWLY